ncbi:hypothetical protein GE253_24720 [Niveispirillum sp. SYP-B3756]|uniref:hypothetical protein n=1 Tax=Niveispirillum sp. SYP-B3756 TaxID=2662178 RepID=UPI0012928BE9|nr:hypothetical protein [Niveispirillum sp. SYP-B3756]MQP68527.1 hypothetical protein [Niveispirillum sp. SYP-B3756]
MKTPISVTFDTNTYSTIANPQIGKLLEKWRPLSRDRLLSKKRRVAWWYIQRCIRKGRIRAGIPEAAFAAESLQNTDRVDLLLVVGKKAPRPNIPPIRLDIIRLALATGFRVMHGPRIGYGALPDFDQGDWAVDELYAIGERQDRMSAFIRHFNEYPLRALQNFGTQLSQAHGLAALNQRYAQAAALNNITLDRYLWRNGIGAEAVVPRIHATRDAFLKALRKLMADWADFDIAATHYAYGYDLLCTEDQGKLVSNSIFGGQHATDVQGVFNVQPVTVMDLAAICWKRFGFPVRRWQS